ncbi:hypothetical protein SAMN06296952_1229 [Oscillospiraceae bacterium]|nr:hypothetical protein SAMN06296952_1229 [Oscillospiraceae bacterium]
MSEILGPELYEDEFMADANTTVLITSDIVLEDGRTGRSIQSFAPGNALASGFNMLIIDDGTIYYLNVRGTFATNDEDYTGNGLPGFSTI